MRYANGLIGFPRFTSLSYPAAWLGFYLLAFSAVGMGSRCQRFVALHSDLFFSNSHLATWIAESTAVEADAVWDTYVRIVLHNEEGSNVARAADLLNQLTPSGRVLALRRIAGRFLFYDSSYLGSLEASDDVVPQNGLIADIGCAAGYTCSYLAFERPNRRFIVMDHNENFTLAARRNLNQVTSSMGLAPDRNMVIRADARHFVLAGPKVDAFIANFIFQHVSVKQQAKLMHEMASSLVPGGLVVIHEPIYGLGSYEDPEYQGAVRIAAAIRSGAIYRQADFWMIAAFQRRLITDAEDPPDDVWAPSTPSTMEGLAKNEGLSIVGEPFRGPDYFRIVLRKPPKN